MHPKNLSILDYSYSLPDERIARYPLPDRDQSRLLIFKESIISEDRYENIALHLPSNALMIFNNTRVVEARLLFKKPTGGVIEIFCLEPGIEYPDISSAMSQTGNVRWHCLVGGASKWKRGQVLEKTVFTSDKSLTLHARYLEKKSDSFLVELSWTPETLTFAELLHETGSIPLPPYLKRMPEASDAQRYQTIYARHDGSVAAPTAGLHFTDSVFRSLDEKSILKDFVTLHVGAGTFKPVKSERMDQHEMHAEFMDVSYSTIKNIRDHLDGPIISVGTTSLRTIESLYWLGVKIGKDGSHGQSLPQLSQWEVYEHEEKDLISPLQALQCLLDWMKTNNTEKLFARTQLLIAPGYQPRIAHALVTNFHQPQSTLLLLVAALVGPRWKDLYKYALDHGFRFLSYGDGNLIWFRNN
jgi:S-adenosylmethionine:tRNA ribosyltransferase-isomerase